jgi:glycosyltransferase involved in cell wall biosynthesis
MTARALPYTSVVVPARNAAATLPACVASLLALDYPPDRLELVVVDNDSTDATGAILAGYDGRLRVVRERSRGRSAARNAGIRAAQGDVVAFTDADCVVDRGWLRNLVAPLTERDDLVVGGAILASEAANRVELFGERIHDHRAAIERERPPYVVTMNCATRLATLRRHALFDERFTRCEDVDLSYRLFSAGCSFRFVSGAIVRHRNERTLRGLFLEGARHGFYGVQACNRHRALVREHGHRGWHIYGTLASRAIDAARRGDRIELTFVSGRAIGSAAGSIRFWHPSS